MKLCVLYGLLFTGLVPVEISTLNKGAVSLQQNKKILLVNVASGGDDASQLLQLEQLHQQFKDSLLVIAFPSNSFGKEPKDSAAAYQYYIDSLGLSFPVAKPCLVTGTNSHPIYGWLANTNSNGAFPIAITKDFQKVLLNKNGEVIGVFSSKVLPADTRLLQAINNNH